MEVCPPVIPGIDMLYIKLKNFILNYKTLPIVKLKSKIGKCIENLSESNSIISDPLYTFPPVTRTP